MGNPKGFLTIKRKEAGYRPVEERINDYQEVEIQLPDDERQLQAARCMDCGVPFCHWACPVCNEMPEWQDKIYQGKWKEAYDILSRTNNFPEFTGRVCPAPCEAACVLSINDNSVTIRQNELAVIEKAFQEGYIKAIPPKTRSDKKIAVIGSGPAGLACADLLNKWGHNVTLYESADKVGGYLRYGIPDFKLDKNIIDRRIYLLKEEGLIIKTDTKAGKDITTEELKKNYDAVCLTIGARKTRDLPVEGRELKGIHFAMEYLEQQNRLVKGDPLNDLKVIKAFNKRVVVIGGGDTGSDCVGSANRQGAKSITQIELLDQPTDHRSKDEPWPLWPKLMKTSSSHEEGCERMWNVMTKKFIGTGNQVTRIEAVMVEWSQDAEGNSSMEEIPGSEFIIEADLVFLAMGFVSVEQDGIVKDLNLELNDRGNIKIDDNSMTSIDGIFSAGDSSRGASLVVYAISDGQAAAEGVNKYLAK
ncbi:MAG: glutamate synthase subunit beta [Bacteroidales bacterium]|jgi:glutamate synthase (NADPH/NADH) small chain|nr:glutamate synthase subunit beta [Bacteroidales bacterium]